MKEFNQVIYNERYKYGYNWAAYDELGNFVIDKMRKTGAQDKRIIDIGCGLGWFADKMYFNVSRTIKGIDFSEIAINFHGKRLFPTIEMEVANIYEYDYAGYDVAVLMEVLEHLDGDINLLTRLKSGTLVYATVPYADQRADITHVREYTEEYARERYSKVLDVKNVERFDQFIVIHGVRL